VTTASLFPTFQAASPPASIFDDARRMAEEALALHLAGMAEDDEPIPEPSSLEAVMADRENRDAVAILVKAPPATTKAVRVNMTMPENELDEIDKFSAEHGYTRSGFLLHAAKKAIGEAEVVKSNAARVRALAERVIERLEVPAARLSGTAQPSSEKLLVGALRAVEVGGTKVDPETDAILEALRQISSKP
jgi:HicB_like antitoxin of bacterial toxin-antitoxin system